MNINWALIFSIMFGVGLISVTTFAFGTGSQYWETLWWVAFFYIIGGTLAMFGHIMTEWI